MSSYPKGAFRVGRPGRHEAAADVTTGDPDQMSMLAAMIGIPLCGRYFLGASDIAGRSCTRPAGHAEQDGDGMQGGSQRHPAHKHVVASADGIALAVWW